MQIAIIGAGAAGMMAAVTAAEHHPAAKIIVFEKGWKALKKVSISGGGRCNLTNACVPASEFLKAYPRGSKQLKHAFYRFSNNDTMDWFSKNGVPLLIQADGCVFPQKQDAMEIVNCLMHRANSFGIEIRFASAVEALHQDNEGWKIKSQQGIAKEVFNKVIITTGGSPKAEGLDWLRELGHSIVYPVPSLFSFNVKDSALNKLMGVVADNVLLSIPHTTFKAEGPLLITHWGISGPAVLKLSSYAARYLHEVEYETVLQVNWIHGLKQEAAFNLLSDYALTNKAKRMAANAAMKLPIRLWSHLIEKAGFATDKKYAEAGSKQLRKLAELLTSDKIGMSGKTTFKEEYVTAGGVALQDVNMHSMESKICKDLYFAGEVLDIDAITGGYNLQAAWSTGYVAGLLQ